MINKISGLVSLDKFTTSTVDYEKIYKEFEAHKKLVRGILKERDKKSSNLVNLKSEIFKGDIAITSTPIEEDIYRNIIESSQSSDNDKFIGLVTKKLLSYTPEEIIGFRLRTDMLLRESYTSQLWCAAYIMNGGCSDDCFEYFRLWLITLGKDHFYPLVNNPDYLIESLNIDHSYQLEEFLYVANNAFQIKTGRDLYDYIDDDFMYREENCPGFDNVRSEDNPESMKEVCPMLYQFFIGSDTSQLEYENKLKGYLLCKSIIEVNYYEVMHDNNISHIYTNDEFDSLDFGLDITLDNGQTCYFNWSNKFGCYGVGLSEGSYKDSLDQYSSYIVTRSSRWDEYIYTRIIDIEVHRKELKTKTFEGNGKLGSDIIPSTIEINFGGGKKIYISTFEDSLNGEYSFFASNISVFFDESTAKTYGIV